MDFSGWTDDKGSHYRQQNVYAIAGRSVGFKFYLRSTFGHVGQFSISKSRNCINSNAGHKASGNSTSKEAT